MPRQVSGTKTEQELLADFCGRCYADPLAFVLGIFPWKTKGTPLATEQGPDAWQVDILVQVGDGTLTAEEALQVAVASGHGIGKSALVAWLILWFVSTRMHPQIVVTANTKEQLEKKTWRELAKWHKLARNGHWFKWTATKFYHVDHESTWFAAAVPWSKERSEAFAGTHETHVLMIFDEASAVDDRIWEVASGAMTTPGAIWIAFGNPTKNTGRFKECWGRFRHRWVTRQIDSRSAKKANQKQIAQWIEDYGEDSDFVRVRVRGVFPRAGDLQLIPTDVVERAMAADYPQPEGVPLVIGVDVARFGDDQSVIAIRRGRQLDRLLKFRGMDTMAFSSKVAELMNSTQADLGFVDGVGIGAGVVDRLVQLGFKRKIIEVQSGGSPDESNKDAYYNKRMEMWARMKDWLKAADIPDDPELRDDLIGPEYGYDAKMRMQLERKEDMKKRGLASPDCGDALALTFAHETAPRIASRPMPARANSHYNPHRPHARN